MKARLAAAMIAGALAGCAACADDYNYNMGYAEPVAPRWEAPASEAAPKAPLAEPPKFDSRNKSQSQ